MKAGSAETVSQVDHKGPLTALTEREQEILRLLAQGRSDRDIAEGLVLTVGTVKWYNRQIYNKLNVNNRTEAATFGQQMGLLDKGTPAQPARIAHNLPAQLTTFVGRRQALAQLGELLRTSRLVTLSGPPGAGKTRLALEAASQALVDFPDGVYFVPLAAVAEPDLVLQSIAQALGVKEAQESLYHAVTQRLDEERVLLLLDNFEHLLEAAPLVTELLAAAPDLSVLVTSREVLRLYGEQEFPVPPLQVPALDGEISLAEASHTEAVELFVQRASATLPDFALQADNVAAVAAICVHLDGLPLAIELAAARIKFYAPQNLLLRLGSRLDALSDGPRDFPSRQRTLRATLAWSYDLLDDEDKTLFARLGVFAGGWTLEDAQAVCGGGLRLPVAAGLEFLVNKSLVLRDSQTEARFMLLETMREYTLEKLRESGEIEALFEGHARHFLALAESRTLDYDGGQEQTWLRRVEAHHDIMRAALRWSLDSAHSAMSLRLSASLARFWRTRDYLSEGRAWLTQAIQQDQAAESPRALADSLGGWATWPICNRILMPRAIF